MGPLPDEPSRQGEGSVLHEPQRSPERPTAATPGGGPAGEAGHQLGSRSRRGGDWPRSGRLSPRSAAGCGDACAPRPGGGAPARSADGAPDPGGVAGGFGRGLRALQQRPPDRHVLRHGRRSPALPGLLGRRGDGARGLRASHRPRVPHLGERHLAAGRVLQRQAERLEPEPAGVPGGRRSAPGQPRRHVDLEERGASLAESQRAHDRCELREPLGGSTGPTTSGTSGRSLPTCASPTA